MKYILLTSILLNPLCSSVEKSINTSLYAYSKDIYIKKSTSPSNNYVKNLFSSFYKILSHYLKKQEEIPTIPTISFIVPFPQICNYQDNNTKDKSVASKFKFQGYNPW